MKKNAEWGLGNSSLFEETKYSLGVFFITSRFFGGGAGLPSLKLQMGKYLGP